MASSGVVTKQGPDKEEITMTAHHPDSSSTDETLARHQAFAEVLEGKRQMRWSDWAVPIYDSKCLTAAGQRAAIWAMETLQHALGDDFLQRAAAAPAIHPIYSFGLWSGANDVPWVHANLFQLAAQIELQIRSHSRRWRDVQQTMTWNLDTISWIHSLLQLEIASLGLKAGWQSQFEPELGNG